ncbi:MAG: hypothetical protein IJ060_05850 [Oscillospiraceae bacterium]|nr:hypothetical protein [Oscillospiraceae bacterium]
MGDRLRRLGAVLVRACYKASMLCLVIFSTLLLTFVIRGTPDNVLFSPGAYLKILLACYLVALFSVLVLTYRELEHAAVRIDEALIGNTFGGFGKPDKLFCEGMNEYVRDHPRAALECFLAVQEYELTDKETGVLSFYIGRCYQLLDCASNAAGCYETAVRNGFPRHFAKLFQARSYSECGDYERSYEAFLDLLEHDPPPEFYFLYTDIGYLFIKQKKPEEAITWFQRSIDKRQNFAFALSGMAIANLQLGNFKEAREYRYQALINRLKDPRQFRNYYEETKQLMLEEHPEWAEQTGKPAEEQPAAPQPGDENREG